MNCAWLATLALLAAAHAQEPTRPPEPNRSPEQGPPLPPKPAGATGELRVINFVAAMVGDKAILASQVTDQWRMAVLEDEKRPPALRKLGPSATSKRHALWRGLLENGVTIETTAQSARLLGKSPSEVEEQVERLVQDELARQAEASGGLNAFARELNIAGQSMGTRADDLRSDILSQMARYQGIMRDLREQHALLATPKEMKARFDANPKRFERPGVVKLAYRRFALEQGAEQARQQATAMLADWRTLPQPVTEALLRQRGAAMLDVPMQDAAGDGIPATRTFARTCKVGELSNPVADDAYVWVFLCVARSEAVAPSFADPAVQAQLSKEIEAERRQAIGAAMFQESRVGVSRLPWGEPAAMERSRRPAIAPPGR